MDKRKAETITLSYGGVYYGKYRFTGEEDTRLSEQAAVAGITVSEYSI